MVGDDNDRALPFVSATVENATAESIRARRGVGGLIKLDRMLLHSPSFAEGWNSLFGAVRGKLSLDGRLRELVILVVAVLNEAEYEWYQHEPVFFSEGGTKEQASILRTLRSDDGSAINILEGVETASNFESFNTVFSRLECEAIQLAISITRDIKPHASLKENIKAKIGMTQLVELIGTICSYNCVSRFLVACDIEPPDK
jgi:alkylhydroperoxidase family enzyme